MVACLRVISELALKLNYNLGSGNVISQLKAGKATAMRIMSVNQMYQADSRMSDSGLSGASLMDAAGQACAEVVHDRWPEGRIFVLCGPGNNGGDGFVAYRYLEQFNRDVKLFLLGDVAQLSGDAAGAAELVHDDILPIGQLLNEDELALDEGDIVVDALFGAGLSRPLEGEALQIVSLINNSEAKVISIDMPSGIDGDTGKILSVAIEANACVTFEALKCAHVEEPAASMCGEVIVKRIGITDSVLSDLAENVYLNTPELWAEKLPWPSRMSHKHDRGRLGVISGGAGHTGAARLAAMAGLRMGAGVVTLIGEQAAIPEMAASSLALMMHSHRDVDELYLKAREQSSLVFGPAAGLTESTRFKVAALLKTGIPVVLDADALSVYKDDPSYLFGLLHDKCVLTPHVGEFERIFPGLLLNTGNKLNAVREAAKRAGCVVVLKGADTVIASPSGEARVNIHGSPFLATAGTGDVLAGMIGGWIAQGMSAFDSASASVWLHGEASLTGGAGLISEDLMEYFPKILTRFYEENSRSNVLWERKIEISS